MKTKEKIKKFWNEFKKNWLWINIGFYIGITIVNWIGYFFGFITLEITIIFTLMYPLILFGVYYIKKSKYQKNIYKLVWVVGFGLPLGGIMWFCIIYIFHGAPWAPLRNSPLLVQIVFSVISTVLCWALGMYIMYRVGKKREWRFPSTY